MSDNVIPLVPRTAPGAEGYDGLVCPCGESWFTATVCADTDGRITGWLMSDETPQLVCVGCKTLVTA